MSNGEEVGRIKVCVEHDCTGSGEEEWVAWDESRTVEARATTRDAAIARARKALATVAETDWHKAFWEEREALNRVSRERDAEMRRADEAEAALSRLRAEVDKAALHLLACGRTKSP